MPSKIQHRVKKDTKKPINSTLEATMLFVAIAEPLMTIPQIAEVFSHPGHHEVSLITWVLYMVAAVMWLIYGIKMHNMPLILTGILWMIMDGAVVVGVLLY